MTDIPRTYVTLSYKIQYDTKLATKNLKRKKETTNEIDPKIIEILVYNIYIYAYLYIYILFFVKKKKMVLLLGYNLQIP